MMTETAPPNHERQPTLEERQMAAADSYMQAGCSILVNGVRTALPQLDIGWLLARLAFNLGLGCGKVFSMGDLGSIMRIRKVCIEAFEAGVKSVKIDPPPMPPDSRPLKERLNS